MIDLWDSLIRTVSALAIVLVLMGLLAVTARRLTGNRLAGSAGARPLVQVLASGYIAPRKSIALVAVAGEYLIVGTTSTDLVPLGRVSDAGKLEALLAAPGSTPSQGNQTTRSSMLTAWLQHLPTGFQPDKEHHGDR